MFHRHELREPAVEWPTAEGTVVEVHAAAGDDPEAPTTYLVDVRPRNGAPFRATVQLAHGARLHVGFYSRGRAHGPYRAPIRAPRAKEVAWFVVDPKSATVQFDPFDRRNMDMPGHEEEWARQVLAHAGDAGPEPTETAPGSPRWIVPPLCPTCGAKVNQARASFELEPHCEFCHNPLPVQPIAGARLTPADVVARGSPCRAEVVKLAPVKADGRPAGSWAFLVNLAPDGVPPYQVEVVLAVPEHDVPLLHRGWRAPVVILPGADPRLVAIDWSRAGEETGGAPITVPGDRRYWAYYDNPDDGYDHVHTGPPTFGRPLGSRADWPCGPD